MHLLELGEISIVPFREDAFKEGSFTFTLDRELSALDKTSDATDLREGRPSCAKIVMSDQGFVLEPGEFILGKTFEHLRLSGNIACFLSTRGSCAQIGLNVLHGSHFVEPATDRQLIIEIANSSRVGIRLYPGLPIVKGIFATLDADRQFSDVGVVS
jgi:dCTP deaminase